MSNNVKARYRNTCMMALLYAHWEICTSQEPRLMRHATASFFGIPPRRNALTTGLVHAVWAVNKTI